MPPSNDSIRNLWQSNANIAHRLRVLNSGFNSQNDMESDPNYPKPDEPSGAIPLAPLAVASPRVRSKQMVSKGANERPPSKRIGPKATQHKNLILGSGKQRQRKSTRLNVVIERDGMEEPEEDTDVVSRLVLVELDMEVDGGEEREAAVQNGEMMDYSTPQEREVAIQQEETVDQSTHKGQASFDVEQPSYTEKMVAVPLHGGFSVGPAIEESIDESPEPLRGAAYRVNEASAVPSQQSARSERCLQNLRRAIYELQRLSVRMDKMDEQDKEFEELCLAREQARKRPAWRK